MPYDETLHGCAGFREPRANVFYAAWEWLDDYGVRFTTRKSRRLGTCTDYRAFLRAFDVVYISTAGMYLRKAQTGGVRISDPEECMGYLTESSDDGERLARQVHVYTVGGVLAHLDGEDVQGPPTPVGQLPYSMFRAMLECGVI